MIRRPPRSTLSSSSAASDVYKRQILALILLGVLVYLAENNLDAYKLRILNLGAIYATLGVSLNLIYGFTGQFSLGHAVFMAMFAYVTSLLVLAPFYKEMVYI